MACRLRASCTACTPVAHRLHTDRTPVAPGLPSARKWASGRRWDRAPGRWRGCHLPQGWAVTIRHPSAPRVCNHLNRKRSGLRRRIRGCERARALIQGSTGPRGRLPLLEDPSRPCTLLRSSPSACGCVHGCPCATRLRLQTPGEVTTAQRSGHVSSHSHRGSLGFRKHWRRGGDSNPR